MAFVQADRPFRITTPLGPDTLLLVGFQGREAVSQLFAYQIDVLAENAQDVAFDKLLGQKISVDALLPTGQRRFFHGICNKVRQGARDPDFTAYRLDLVPQLWTLTKRVQSRIFQHLSVPDILKQVLDGLDPPPSSNSNCTTRATTVCSTANPTSTLRAG